MTPTRLLELLDEHGARLLDLVEVATFGSAAKAVRELPGDTEAFALLVVGDSTGETAGVLGEVAEASLERGAYWVSTWGLGCERLHDIFDEVAVGDGSAEAFQVLTTWHDDEPLVEALLFTWHHARPYESQARGPLTLVISVADPASAEAVRQAAAAGLREDCQGPNR